MIKCYNDAVMRPLFSVMTKILSYIESQMDETSFDSKNFKGDYFGTSIALLGKVFTSAPGFTLNVPKS